MSKVAQNNIGVKKVRVAIVHDFMVGWGAERVVEQLLEMYPYAPLYTSCINDNWSKLLAHREIKTGILNVSFFQKTRKFIPLLRRWWFESLDLREFDIVISSSGSEAKAIRRLKPGALHVGYCHSPTHYYWVRYDEYIQNPGFGFFDPVARLGLKMLVGSMRKWDYKAAQRADVMVANSTCVQERIKQFYNRESTVVHPPVNIERFSLQEVSRKGYVVAGRQTPYKRIDLAVRACTLVKVPLKVIGNGPEHEKLRSLAGPTVEFLTRVSDEDMPKHFAGAKAFIFANEDDFGIVPVEAMATGTPVIAYKKGGALDYVKPGAGGLFFEEQTVECLVQAIKDFEKETFKPNQVRKVAEAFSPERFRMEMKAVIDKALLSRSATR